MTYIGQEGSATRYGTALGYGFWGTSTDATVTKTTETEMKTLPVIDMKITLSRYCFLRPVKSVNNIE